LVWEGGWEAERYQQDGKRSQWRHVEWKEQGEEKREKEEKKETQGERKVKAKPKKKW